MSQYRESLLKWILCIRIMHISILSLCDEQTYLTMTLLTLTVPVATINAQWEGMGDVGSARYEPALLPPCPTIRVLSHSNCQSSTLSVSKYIFRNSAL